MPQIPAIVTTKRFASSILVAITKRAINARKTDIAGTLAKFAKRRSNQRNQWVSFSSSKKKFKKTNNKNEPPKAAISA